MNRNIFIILYLLVYHIYFIYFFFFETVTLTSTVFGFLTGLMQETTKVLTFFPALR